MGKRRSRRRKIVLILVSSAVFLCFVGLFNNNNNNPLKLLWQTNPDLMCIFVTPSVRRDEFRPNTKSGEMARICPKDYGTYDKELKWDINFNAERTFFYRPGDFIIEKSPKQSTVKRLTEFIAEKGTPVLGRYFSTMPKIIHFIWNDEIIPTIFVENLRRFQELHPTWQIHFWTIETGRNFIQIYEPNTLKTFDDYKDNMTRADALRYIIMYHFGGAYFDLDSKVVKPLDELTAHHECILGSEPIENAVLLLKRRSVLANAGLLCKPRHPFFGFLIDQLSQYGRFSAGPTYLSKCLNLYLDSLIDPDTVPNINLNFEIKIVPHELFECKVNDRILLDLKIMCEELRPTIDKFTKACRKNMQFSLTPYCDNLYHQVSRSSRMEFEACLEWIISGEEKRQPSPQAFVIHSHFGTSRHLDDLILKKQNVISKIIPNVIEHA